MSTGQILRSNSLDQPAEYRSSYALVQKTNTIVDPRATEPTSSVRVIKSKLKPHFTVRHSTSLFSTFGVVFLVVGFGVFSSVRNVDEIAIDYTNCASYTESRTLCEDVIMVNMSSTCHCEIPFRVHEDMRQPVNLYYGLTNFYQNHRDYVLSKDEKQLRGELSLEVAVECKSYKRNPSSERTNNVIAPCGAIADSLFNDTISLYSVQRRSAVPLIRKNLIWPRIKNKFHNPPGRNLAEAFRNFSRPQSWRKNIWQLDLVDPSNNGFENEDFIVWMQPATMSKFRKLYRRVDDTQDGYEKVLPKGDYKLLIDYAYPVIMFKGRKTVVISSICAFGGKNMFLVYCCFTLGTCCMLVSLIFIYLKNIQNRKKY